MTMRLFFSGIILALSFLAGESASWGKEYGPLHGEFISEGVFGTQKAIDDPNLLKAGANWTLNFWIQPSGPLADKTLLAGFGKVNNAKGEERFLAQFDDGLRFWGGSVDVLMKVSLDPGKWQMLTAVYDSGVLKLYKNGEEKASQAITLADAKPLINLAPLSPWADGGHFGGKIAFFTLSDRALSQADITALSLKKEDFTTLTFVKGSPESWDPKANGNKGNREPKPEDLPKSLAAPGLPGKPKPPAFTSALPGPDGTLILAGPWKMIEAPKLKSDGKIISKAGYAEGEWYSATVPGTVLTTLVDQGIYPDPYFGLNNLQIPETLNKQDYWYRLEFDVPADFTGRQVTLLFNGINYQAEIWVNGSLLPQGIRGAFIRGSFDVGALLEPGKKNVLAVKVSPPPNPGIPHEQSLRAGAGPNGGAMCYDGPTFFCSEGWDWIPGIRDRETGIWQDVTLKATDAVVIGDPQVITRVPEPAGARADVTLEIELRNTSSLPQSGVLKASFEGVALEKKVTLAAKASQTVVLTPAEFPQLSVSNPRLWWPNGYGKPELYHLALSYTGDDGKVSDRRSLRFGMRELSVVLTAVDARQRTGRFEFFPAQARSTEVIKHDHASLVNSPQGWVPTVAEDIQKLPGIRLSEDTGTERFLEVRINGVRIPWRGGNWGMDDAMKRISRAQLEPYVRLQRDSNFNILRNWCGQSTSEALFELCDEYGIMVFSEFWVSTQWSNVEPKDNDLFLANAADTIKRFRTHPSIVLWCGRNEGVPPPLLNAGLDDLIRKLDGTRYYQPASITINLGGSGPWKYIPPEEYFKKRGTTTELGLPSPLTADSIRSMMAAEDLWPPNDTWGYHDWLPSGAMDTKTFLAALGEQYGDPVDFEDFVRKAQMINYTSYRAMYEGLNANLWKPSTGTLLWMSHPSWPSMVWQIYGWDYQPNAAFYGVKEGCEPVHVQMNLPDSMILVANTTLKALEGVKVVARVYDAKSQLLSTKEAILNVPVNGTATSFVVDPEANKGVNFVKLELFNTGGELLSDNFYWRAPKVEDLKVLNKLPQVKLSATARMLKADLSGESRVEMELVNPEKSVALMTFLTLRKNDGQRVLPAYASDNYISLLPGEKRKVIFEVPGQGVPNTWKISIEGWNLEAESISVQ